MPKVLYFTAITKQGKPTQITAPIGRNVSTDEITITVTDPRHPLYGQCFQIVGEINRPDHGLCYVVWLPEGTERHIPRTATNLVPFMPPPAIPLNLFSLEKLLTVYAHLSQQLKEQDKHVIKVIKDSTINTTIKISTEENINSKPNNQQSNYSSASLASIKSAPTRKTVPPDGENLLQSRQIKSCDKRSGGSKQ